MDERPIEKLLTLGPHGLSNAELIAILLKSGTEKHNAMDTARLLLDKSDGILSILSGFSVEKMTEIPGVGKKKAATISAAFELGRRFISEKSIAGKTAVTGPEVVYKMMLPLLKGLSHEECWLLFLNRANYVIGKEKLTSGGLSSTTIDNRMVIIRAMEKKASGLILIHNHPSGNPRPGAADLQQTEKLKNALSPVEISLMDHIIVCDESYFSFSDEKVFSAE